MGGTALKNISVQRMNIEEFNDVSTKVMRVIKECSLECAIPKFYSSKDSFGDVDIVVKVNTPHDQELCIKHVISCFEPKDQSKNGTVFSFDVQNHQVDLIFVYESNYETSLNYLSYNDLFNLLGRLAHKLGFKLGHKGLEVVIRNGNYVLGEVLITKDLSQIFGILDVDYTKYIKGFETKEDIFNFVIASCYFNKDIFAYENLNHINRVRNKKRKIYEEFVKYIETHSNSACVHVNKEEFVNHILSLYPEAQKKIGGLRLRLQMQKDVHDIFNGDIVSRIKGVQGPELGVWMKHFKKKYNNDFWLTNRDDVIEIILNESLRDDVD